MLQRTSLCKCHRWPTLAPSNSKLPKSAKFNRAERGKSTRSNYDQASEIRNGTPQTIDTGTLPTIGPSQEPDRSIRWFFEGLQIYPDGSRCQLQQRLSIHSAKRGRGARAITSEKPEFELVSRKVSSEHQSGVPFPHDLLRREVSSSGGKHLSRPLSRRAKSPRARQPADRPRRRSRTEGRRHPLSRATWWHAELLLPQGCIAVPPKWTVHSAVAHAHIDRITSQGPILSAAHCLAAENVARRLMYQQMSKKLTLRSSILTARGCGLARTFANGRTQ